MSERKTIVKLDRNTSDPCKAEEIEYLEEFVDGIPAGSYLSNTFRKEFVAWVKQQIKDDFTADAWEYIGHYNVMADGTTRLTMHAVMEQNQALKAGRDADSRTIEQATKQIEQYQLQLREMNTALDESKKEVERAWSYEKQRLEHMDELQVSLRETKQKMHAARADVVEALLANDAMQDEIIRLKAQLFDCFEKIEALQKEDGDE
jgi:hypothetical protein